VLCSIGAGPHAELLAVTQETFDEYARRHGYEAVIPDPVPEPKTSGSRPVIQVLATVIVGADSSRK